MIGRTAIAHTLRQIAAEGADTCILVRWRKRLSRTCSERV
jgi:hypothetical protein